MKLYLLRHGEPQPKEKDPQRRLTPRGQLDIATIGRFLEQNEHFVPEIWHSNKNRVRETADIIGQAVGCARLLERPDLAPLDPVGPVRSEIIGREQDLMLVGHLPFLPLLAGQLLGCPRENSIFRFRTGEIVCLERDEEGLWQILFVIYPGLLE